MESEQQFLQDLLDDLKDANENAQIAIDNAGGYDDGGEGMFSYKESIWDMKSEIKTRLQKLSKRSDH